MAIQLKLPLPGVIDLDSYKHDEYFQGLGFPEGNCMWIALALHRWTDWPIYHLDNHPDWKDGHAVVKSPKGWLDVRLNDPENDKYEVVERVRFFRQWDLYNQVQARSDGLQVMRLAVPLAKAVLERHFPEESFSMVFEPGELF